MAKRKPLSDPTADELSQVDKFAPTAHYHCVVRNTEGRDFYIGDIDATSAEEALEMIESHIAVAKRETLKWFDRWLRGMNKAERQEFTESIANTLKLHENMRKSGYDEPELYKPLELPAVRVKVYYPGTDTCAYNLSSYIGLENLGLK